MKIVSLNIWGGRAGSELVLDFFRKHKDFVDIFCLQEVWSDRYDDLDGDSVGGRKLDHSTVMIYGLQEISSVLDGHTAFFRSHLRDNYGLCMFVRKDMRVLSEGEHYVHKYKVYEPDGDIGKHARNIQWVTVDDGSGPKTIFNFHGLWNGQGKGDSDDRIAQSEAILSVLETQEYPYAILGDFNLTPDTKSLQMFEEFGLRNLITKYGITSTRTSLYDKAGRYADYAFVSEGITVQEFAVLPDEVSDHAPLMLII